MSYTSIQAPKFIYFFMLIFYIYCVIIFNFSLKVDAIQKYGNAEFVSIKNNSFFSIDLKKYQLVLLSDKTSVEKRVYRLKEIIEPTHSLQITKEYIKNASNNEFSLVINNNTTYIFIEPIDDYKTFFFTDLNNFIIKYDGKFLLFLAAIFLGVFFFDFLGQFKMSYRLEDKYFLFLKNIHFLKKAVSFLGKNKKYILNIIKIIPLISLGDQAVLGGKILEIFLNIF